LFLVPLGGNRHPPMIGAQDTDAVMAVQRVAIR
jgi:hypothetical protein